ncbi:hypothetical protein KY285_033888 [Solanum tuberosum]|nr:hypothetical protein KY285_033888 [Solanum tuberosum]
MNKRSLCANMPPERMLPFASQVAAIGCRALSTRPSEYRYCEAYKEFNYYAT